MADSISEKWDFCHPFYFQSTTKLTPAKTEAEEAGERKENNCSRPKSACQIC
jgi:hypothetical protein